MKSINESTTIGEYHISAGTLPPRDAIKVQIGLVNLLGEGLFAALSKKGASKEEIGSAVLTKLSSAVDADAALKLAETVLTCVRINGNRVTLDSQEFYGDPMLVWKTVFFALQANFADFFRGVSSRFGRTDKAPESNQSS